MKKLLTVSSLIGLISFSLIGPISKAHAQTSQPLTVAPARQQLDIDPGETATAIFKLINGSDTPVSGTLAAYDFIVTKDDGTPEFLENQPLSGRYSAVTWMKLPYSRLSIPANDKVEMQIKITAPKDAYAGGHYAAVIFEPASSVSPAAVSNQSGASAVSPRIAALFYFKVPGEFEETALITKFTAPKFSQTGPIDITTEVRNDSPVHIRPTGTITVSNMFGDIISHLPLEEANIFPEASRAYLNTLPTKWLLGKYKAELNLAYGSQGKVAQGVIYFTVFPVALVTYFVILIAALAYAIITLIKKGKKHEIELEQEVAALKQEVETLEAKK